MNQNSERSLVQLFIDKTVDIVTKLWGTYSTDMAADVGRRQN